MRVSRSWLVDEALRLDARGNLAPQIRRCADELMAALGEPPLP